MEKDFGAYFKRTREENNYKTKTDFANASGITLATISRIENNKHHPKPDTLKVIADHLKTVTYEELLLAAGYLEEVEERKTNFEPSTEDLLDVLYSLDKGKREKYIRMMKALINESEKPTPN